MGDGRDHTDGDAVRLTTGEYLTTGARLAGLDPTEKVDYPAMAAARTCRMIAQSVLFAQCRTRAVVCARDAFNGKRISYVKPEANNA